MAGRPVAARGGSDGLKYALIAFVILTVVSLGLFVWQLTTVQTYIDEAERLRDQIAAYGTPPDYYRQEARNTQQSTFAVIRDDMNRFAQLVVGQNAIYPQVRDVAERTLADVAEAHPNVVSEDAVLLTAISNLSQALAEQDDTVEQLRTDLAEAQQQRDQAVSDLNTARSDYEAGIAEMEEQLTELRAQQQETLTRKDEQLEEAQQAAEAAQQQASETRVAFERAKQDWSIDRERMDRLIDQQNRIIRRQKQTFDFDEILQKADGEIARAIPGSGVCYINIGARENVKPGMSFEVYSTAAGRIDDVRGKASIEVVTVQPTTAECRITRSTPARPVVEGDKIVNVAYEKDTKPRFVVIGDFDLNYDNIIDPNGKEQVGNIIRSWGGEVVDQIGPQTDYVVIGVAPQVPEYEPGTRISPTVQYQIEQQALQRLEFDERLQRARSFNIPIMTQTQFLFLSGFTQGTGVSVSR